MKFAHEKFCKDILTVYDNLSKGVEHSTANKSQELAPEVKTVVEGMEMTLKTLDDVSILHKMINWE